jgi:aquaporin Z
MNPARSLGRALVLNDWTSWWAYLLGPIIGAIIAVGIASPLRGPVAAKLAPPRPRERWASAGCPDASARPSPPLTRAPRERAGRRLVFRRAVLL